MDCLQACEILSAAHDGELVDAALLAQARSHADSCAGCTAFVRVLDRMASAPPPGAPPELVARVETIARPVLAPRPTRDRRAWLPRVAVLASAAAVLLVVASVGGIALLGGTGQTAEEAVLTESTSDEALRAAPSAGTAGDTTSTFANSLAGPAYVSLDGAIWTLTGILDAAPGQRTPAGSVATGLDGGSPVAREAFYADDNRSALYVTGDDGRCFVFRRVVRTLGGKTFGLVSATAVSSFGAWPTLPGPAPMAADGSPVFVPAGTDDLGVTVFAPADGTTADGFAIAPGTAPDDPAAGNPGWTWWEPLP